MINFRHGVNLIVGDQGSGKSSLYQGICVHGMKKPKSIQLPRKEEVPFILDYRDEPLPVFAFDFEKDNYRTKARFDDDIAFHVGTFWKSHGEMVLAMIADVEGIDKPAIVIMDEPDMALSIRSCRRLVRAFQHIEDLGGQVIATAHNPVLIEGFETVYSLEHGEWMTGKDFIKTQIDEN